MSASENLIVLARVAGAYGIHGELRLVPFSADAQTLLQTKHWHLRKPGMLDARTVQVATCKTHRDELIVRLEECADRTLAESFKGFEVAVARADFPPLPAGEFYWVDLMGLAVQNQQAQPLGTVVQLSDCGANQIVHVKHGQHEILIPFVAHYVQRVDVVQGMMQVDWQVDWGNDFAIEPAAKKA